MFRLAGLITAELAGERRFYSEKGAVIRLLSQPYFIGKKECCSFLILQLKVK